MQATTTTTTVTRTSSTINDVNETVTGMAATTTTTMMTIPTCVAPPPIVLLFITLAFTIGATALLCIAINTDHWEQVTWNHKTLQRLTNPPTTTTTTTNNTIKQSLHYYLDGRVAKCTVKLPKIEETLFLVPMHGGIWTLCIDLTDSDIQRLGHVGFPHTVKCISYLADNVINIAADDVNWQHNDLEISLHPHMRMQNLSISCSLVCLIILGSAALVGAFGICQRQISAILVTGVMYLLAALFALFTLMIIHFKRQQGRSTTIEHDFYATVDGLIATKRAIRAAKNLLIARHFQTSWSLDFGWSGVILCTITSILWIFLSKVMRYNPFSGWII